MNLKKIKPMLNKLMLTINSIGDWVVGWVMKLFASFWLLLSLCCMSYLIWSGSVWLVDKLWGLFINRYI